MNISVVVVNYRTPGLVRRCLQSLREERALLGGLSVRVVDGGSGDQSAAMLKTMVTEEEFRGWVSFQPLPINGGFGWANNQAILALMQQPGPPDFIHLLNPDCEAERGAVRALVDLLLAEPTAGAVGSQLIEPDGRLSGSAFRFPTVAREFARGARTGLISSLLGIKDIALDPTPSAGEVDWVTGASVMLRTAALRDSCLFDDGFFLYHEEVELMWRLRQAGWSIWCEPASRVRHLGGASTGIHRSGDGSFLLPRRPDYWYESRRRLFALLYGRLGSAAAAMAWAVGHCLWRARRAVGLGGAHSLVARELSDQLRVGLRLLRSDRIRAAPPLNRAPGEEPAWMRWRHST